MKNDIKLQRIILQVVAEQGGRVELNNDLLLHIRTRRARLRRKWLLAKARSQPTKENIHHQLKLLTGNKELDRDDTTVTLSLAQWNYTYYEITAIGHKALESRYKKLGTKLAT